MGAIAGEIANGGKKDSTPTSSINNRKQKQKTSKHIRPAANSSTHHHHHHQTFNKTSTPPLKLFPQLPIPKCNSPTSSSLSPFSSPPPQQHSSHGAAATEATNSTTTRTQPNAVVETVNTPTAARTSLFVVSRPAQREMHFHTAVKLRLRNIVLYRVRMGEIVPLLGSSAPLSGRDG